MERWRAWCFSPGGANERLNDNTYRQAALAAGADDVVRKAELVIDLLVLAE